MPWCRNASESFEQHDAEVDSARVTAEQDVANNSEDILKRIDSNLFVSSLFFCLFFQ